MTTMQTVTPCKPPAPYVGGKRFLASNIIKKIEEIPHKSYVEPFVGMGGLFFRRTHKPSSEVINDYSGEVVNLFRILQRHYEPFIEMLQYKVTSRDEFERLQNTSPEVLTDLERAERFLYLQRTAFGGKITGQNFAVASGRFGARFNANKLTSVLEAIRHRLAGVVIENLDYSDCITRYDSSHTLFYLDPPYWGTEDMYGKHLFNRDEFVNLATQLSSIKGQFILSLNDTPEIRKIFSTFYFQEVEVYYSLKPRGSVKAPELIISSV